jgi:recombination protein RecA
LVTKTNDAKTRVADILASADKKYGFKAGPMSSIVEGVKAVSTGNIAIDNISGVGGIPLGRNTELFGPPSSGKTTTAIQAAASLQKVILSGGDPERGIGPDDLIIYADYEHAMDPDYCLALGLDVEHPQFIFTQPDNLEMGADFVRELVATGLVRMVIFDSVAAMTPSAKIEAETGKPLPALQAKLMSDFLAAFTPAVHKNNVAAIYVNHIYEVMEMGRRPGMPPKTSTPGGRRLKFDSSLRLEYKQIGTVKTNEIDLLTRDKELTVTSTNVEVKVVKNKVGPPMKKARVRVRYGKGFDNFWSALQILVANKYVMYQPGIYKFHKLEAEGLAPDWMPRMTVGTKPPALKGENDLFKAAELYPEWSEGIIAKAQAVIDDLGVKAFSTGSVDPEELDEQEEEPEGDE